MSRLLRFIFSRLTVVIFLMLVQAGVIFAALVYFDNNYAVFQAVSVVVAASAIIYIINQDISPAFKIAWILPIAFLPIFGIALYVLFAKKPLPERSRERFAGLLHRYKLSISGMQSSSSELARENPSAGKQSYYLEHSAFAPLFRGTDTQFFSPGEKLHEAMLEKLRGARRYIFLEYYIVEPGVMWDSILEVLRQKVLEGLDVRFIYDDMGCIITLPNH